MSRELLQQALDALETKYSDYIYDGAGSAIAGAFEDDVAALRAALAQPETQPVNQQIESINAVFDAWRNGEDASMTLGLATPQAQPAPAVQVVLRQPNLFAADPAAPAVPDGWVMVPTHLTVDQLEAFVGCGLCCGTEPMPEAVIDAGHRWTRLLGRVASPAVPAVREPLTAERLQKHAMFAADAPPASAVVLVSSLHRLLGITGDSNG